MTEGNDDMSECEWQEIKVNVSQDENYEADTPS
jgi:hypothetical protein